MIYYLLPVYNESEGICQLLSNMAKLKDDIDLHIIAVDDGSTDGSLRLLRTWADQSKLTILEHKVNRGLGAAMRTGLKHCLEILTERDAVIAMDADNTHDPRYSLDLIAKLNQGFDLVIASRFAGKGREIGVPWHRRMLSRGSSLLLKILTGITETRDFTCGYRAYSYRLLRLLQQKYGDDIVTENGFACMLELLLKSKAIKARITEIPFTLRYDRKQGASKMRIQRTIKDTICLAIKYRR